jgi:hypothetical protein
MANPNTSSLPAYVEQNRLPLIKEAVLDAKTVRLINLQTGVKGSAALNILSTDVVFGNGAACGWNAAGEQTMSQRDIVTGAVKINMPFCDKNFLKTWAEHNVRVAAGQKTLPFEEEFIGGVIDGVKEALDAAIWQGDTASDKENLNKFDGLFKILGSADGVVAKTIADKSYFEAVQEVVAAMPQKSRKADSVVFCSYEFFNAYVQDLVTKNLFHYDGKNVGEEIVIPGTNIRLVAIGGFGDTAKLVAGRLSNFYYGCDLEGDAETFKFWYSDDNQEFRLVINFNAGVQVAFPDEVVVATYSGLTM